MNEFPLDKYYVTVVRNDVPPPTGRAYTAGNELTKAENLARAFLDFDEVSEVWVSDTSEGDKAVFHSFKSGAKTIVFNDKTLLDVLYEAHPFLINLSELAQRCYEKSGFSGPCPLDFEFQINGALGRLIGDSKIAVDTRESVWRFYIKGQKGINIR